MEESLFAEYSRWSACLKAKKWLEERERLL